jgi:hypothetical protein
MSDEKADFSNEGSGMTMMSEKRPRGSDHMMDQAKRVIVQYFNRNAVSRTDTKLFVEDLYIVWFCKTLQNWKALVSTDRVDGHYFEVTYDGDSKCCYLDVYVKAENLRVN